MPYSKATLPDANLESIFSCTNQPVYIVGPDLKVIYANSYTVNLVGKTNLSKHHCYEIFHTNKKQPAACPWKTPVCGIRAEKECICQKGNKENICRINAVPIWDSDGKILAALHMVEVTTEAVRLAEKLLKSNNELQIVNEIGSILSQSLDLEEVLNGALARLIEYSNFRAAGVYLTENGRIELKAHQGISKEFADGIGRMPLGHGISGSAAHLKKTIISENAQHDLRTQTSVLAKEGIRTTIAVPISTKGQVIGVLTLGCKKECKISSRETKLIESIADHMSVVIENAKLYEKTIILSRTDDLTGLFNSRYFEEIMQKQISISKRKNENFALMMLDIDNLKIINDIYGHDGGDMFLRKFADVLRANLREADFYGRYGGDEFVVLLSDTDEKMAKVVAKKLEKKIRATRIFGFDKTPLMSASIGIALFPKSASSMVSLVKAADIAMYRAKQDGKNRICVFESGLLSGINFDSKRLERIAQNADLNAIQTLVTAVDLKDRYTGSHSSEVSRLAVSLAQKLGLAEKELEDLRVAALLHDIGKIGISDNILLKPSKLTTDELKQVRKHPELGVSILKYSKEFKEALPIVLYHHERWDGKGYPHGIKGENIPLLARIISVADAFEAMISDRPYRKAMSKKSALSQLWKFADKQFDPMLIKTFTSIIRDLGDKETSSSLSVINN